MLCIAVLFILRVGRFKTFVLVLPLFKPWAIILQVASIAISCQVIVLCLKFVKTSKLIIILFLFKGPLKFWVVFIFHLLWVSESLPSSCLNAYLQLLDNSHEGINGTFYHASIWSRSFVARSFPLSWYKVGLPSF